MDLFRTKSVLAWTVLLSATMAVTACSGDEETPDSGGGGGGQDAGMGQPDATEEADGGGFPDVVRPDDGGGRPDRPDPCPNGTEGCECTSTATAAVVPFIQEDCEADLLCVHWDLISGLSTSGANPQLEGAVKSCVKPCTQDSECGTGRSCRSIGFTEQSGAGKICVDRVASWDEPCSGSRLATEQIADPMVMQYSDEIIACEDGLDCQFFLFGDGFNPDEALCMKICDEDAECTHPQLSYCNQRHFASTSTVDPFIGVCTDGAHAFGSICGSADPDKIFRVSSDCDTSEATCGPNADACPFCVALPYDANNDITPPGQGTCISSCNANNPCFGNRTCVPMVFNGGDGACSDECSPIPETCDGPGSNGNGQDCLALGLQSGGDIAFCIDRELPALNPSVWNSAGQITDPGDDCGGDLANYSYFRCPEKSTCLGTADQGFCVFGCRAGDATYGTGYCQGILGTMTATCTEPQAGFGVCATM